MKRGIFFLLIAFSFFCLVSGQQACCLQRTDGAICQLATQDQCSSGWKGVSSCAVVSECTLGCCIDSERGTCGGQTTKAKCDADGGNFIAGDANCETNQCKKGCCTVGTLTDYLNNLECQFLENALGEKAVFSLSITQGQCKGMEDFVDELACVTIQTDGTNACQITTPEECEAIGGEPKWNGELCSNPTLETDIDGEHHKVCIPGRDEVFWADSEGNIENIWWQNPSDPSYNLFFKEKEESCNPSGANINSATCGNCNRALGSTCGEVNGDIRCISLDCADAPGTLGPEDRKNNDEWCVYNSVVGEGKDVPGSEHYKYSCVNGEVVTERCDAGQQDSARVKVCTQEEIELSGGRTLSTANCIEADQYTCLELNENPFGLKEECEKRPNCYYKPFNFGRGESGGFCLPQFPLGFGTRGDELPDASEYCHIGNYGDPADSNNNCMKIRKKSWFGGGYSCKAGCQCDSIDFTRTMNDICTSIGDCGASANIEGRVTDRGYKVTGGAPRLTDEMLEELRIFAIPRDYYLSLSQIEIDNNILVAFIAFVDGEAYRLDNLIYQIFWADIGSGFESFIEGYEDAFTEPEFKEAVASEVGAFNSYLENSGKPAITNELRAEVTPSSSVKVELGFWGELLGGKIKKHRYTFECKPWVAPSNGDDCHLCNGDRETCTKYSCEARGLLCDYVEENEGNPDADLCIALEDNLAAPIITPWPEVLTSGFRFGNEESPTESSAGSVELRTQENKCLPLREKVNIGIKTSENAQCIIYFGEPQQTPFYEELEGEYFAQVDGEEFGGYVTEHQRVVQITEAETLFKEILMALDEEDNDITTIQEFDELLGEINEESNRYNMYIRCIDLSGHSDPRDYLIESCADASGEDRWEPQIRFTTPATGSYTPFDLSSQVVDFIIDEPANCRWSSEQNVPFDSMTNEMVCADNWAARIPGKGWPCTTELTGITKEENKFYVKCRDWPALEGIVGSESRRNTMQTDYVYTLKKYKDKIKIDSVKPSASFETGASITSKDLEVRTSGGGNTHTCKFSVNGFSNLNLMWKTGVKGIHTQPGVLFAPGQNSLFIRCSDETGDSAQKQIDFEVIFDNAPSQIARVWQDGGFIHYVLTEPGRCWYSEVGCSNIKENGNLVGMLAYQKISAVKGMRYYILCEDEFGNVPQNGCSIIVTAT